MQPLSMRCTAWDTLEPKRMATWQGLAGGQQHGKGGNVFTAQNKVMIRGSCKVGNSGAQGR